jgi:two-component system response regulator AtoC
MTPETATVLIASHDPLLKNYLKAFLAYLGYPVFCSEDGDDIQAKMREHAPGLVMLDSIPSENEWMEFEKTVRELTPRPAFLFLTDLKNKELKQTWGEGKGLDYIPSPFDPMMLKEKVQQLFVRNHAVPATQEDSGQGRAVSRQAWTSASASILGISKKINEILAILDRVADTDATVLIRGESGTGKELVARRIHERSGRRDKPFIKVLCPAIPETLLESELFGYEKGSFTGAFIKKPGRFEFANQGTIFLDEIGDIPFLLQSKLLQVLQEGEFARLGGKTDVRVNVRIIAATNKDIERAVRDGAFREDLFFRLNVVNIYVPPLRDRKEDIPFLVRSFLDRFNLQFNKKVELSNHTLKLFMEYHWPGNVRELENMLEGMVILGNEKEIVSQLRSKIDPHRSFSSREGLGNAALSSNKTESSAFHDPRHRSTAYPSEERRRQDRRRNSAMDPSNGAAADESVHLKTVGRKAAQKAELDLIRKVLDKTHWNRKEAAKILGISYKALLYKMKRLHSQEPSS